MSPADKTLRVLFVTRAYGRHGGGMERFSYELIREVSKLPSVKAKVLWHRGRRVTSPLFSQLVIPKAIWYARRADVIHIGDPMLSLCGWLIKLLLKKPVAVTVHGLDISYRNTLYQLYLKLFFTNFDRYLPISNHVAHKLQKQNIYSSRISTINPGLHDRLFDPSIRKKSLVKLLNAHTKEQKLKTKYYLFTSGRLVKRKGHAWFIAKVLPKLPAHTAYIIAGSGPEKQNIINAARNANLSVATSEVPLTGFLSNGNNSNPNSPPVILLGRVPDSDLKILYNTIDAFVQPNIPVPNDIEGFGLAMLEAALCSRPVFAAGIDGIPDAIQHRQNGTLLASRNSKQWVSALTKSMSNPYISPQARAYTRQSFSWPAQARKYLSALKSLS